MRDVEEQALHLPDVARREAPVVTLQDPEVDGAVSLHASRPVDVRIEVAQGESPQRPEHGPAAVQARIARPADRSPQAAGPVDEDHVIEGVHRFQAHHRRRIAVLLEDDRGRQRRFQAVGHAAGDHAAERAQAGPVRRRLHVVGQLVQEALDGRRRAESRHQAPLGRRERHGASLVRPHHEVAAAVRSSVRTWPGVQSLPE